MKTLTLSKPLTSGTDTVKELTLRRPTAGDLRGIKLQGIADMDVNTVLTLLPRLCTTPLAPSAVNDLDPADMMAVCEVLAGFFVASSTPSPTTH